jgi:hypothetical protein
MKKRVMAGIQIIEPLTVVIQRELLRYEYGELLPVGFLPTFLGVFIGIIPAQNTIALAHMNII